MRLWVLGVRMGRTSSATALQGPMPWFGLAVRFSRGRKLSPLEGEQEREKRVWTAAGSGAAEAMMKMSESSALLLWYV